MGMKRLEDQVIGTISRKENSGEFSIVDTEIILRRKYDGCVEICRNDQNDCVHVCDLDSFIIAMQLFKSKIDRIWGLG